MKHSYYRNTYKGGIDTTFSYRSQQLFKDESQVVSILHQEVLFQQRLQKQREMSLWRGLWDELCAERWVIQ